MEVLTLRTVEKVRDGAIAELFDRTLREIYGDCFDRPNVTKARTVTLTISIKPKPESINDSGDLERVGVTMSVGKKLPSQSLEREMSAVNRSKGFGFEPDTNSTFPASGQETLFAPPAAHPETLPLSPAQTLTGVPTDDSRGPATSGQTIPQGERPAAGP